MRRPALITALTLCAAILIGCSKLTTENYDKLKIGMTYAEVKALLGNPTDCTDVLTMRNCTWGDAQRYIKVSFVAEQVVVYNATGLR